MVNSGAKWWECGSSYQNAPEGVRGDTPSQMRVDSMFMGEYSHTIDTKGRLIIPSKFRELLGEEFVLTKGLDGCLSIYPMEEWKAFEEKLKALPLTNKNARDFVRFFLSGAMECEIDKQGRFLISSNLRKVASLEKETVIIGVGTRIEIWDKTKWEQYNSEDNISADDIAENMTMLGI